MLEFVAKYAGNIHSQNGEDGIIAECLRRMKITTGYAVEVGGNDGLWLSNTRALLEQGWTGKFVEASWPLYLACEKNWAHRKDVKCICSKVDGHNVNAFVGDDCDLLSIDTDGPDHEIFKGLKAKPGIVIVEIDSSIPPGDEGFNSDGGAGYRAMTQLAISKGYFLLCHTGNLVLVANEYRQLFPEIVGDGLKNAQLYFNRSWLKADAA